MLKKAGCVCLLQGSLKESLYSLNEIFIEGLLYFLVWVIVLWDVCEGYTG